MKKRIRISLYFDEKLEKFFPLFNETINRKSLMGEFLKNVILFLQEVVGDENETAKIIRNIAKGDLSSIRVLFSGKETLTNKVEEESVTEPDLQDFIL